MNDVPKLFERAEEARNLKEDPAYRHATTTLQMEWSNTILLEETSDDQKLKLIQRIMALEAIATRLQSMMNDYVMARRRQAHGS